MGKLSRGQFIAAALAGAGAAGAGAAIGVAASRGKAKTAEDAAAEAWRLMEEEGACRVVVKDGTIVSVAKGRGARPALDMLKTSPRSLEGATVFDSVAGLAVAAAAVKGGAAKVCARTASEGAKALLEKNGVALEAKVVVPEIMNRDLTGPCPLESAVSGLEAPAEIVAAAREWLDARRV